MNKRNLQNDKKYADVPLRVRSWIIIIILFFLALLHPLLTCIFFCFLSFIAVREFLAMFYPRKERKIDFILLFLFIVQCYVIFTTNYTHFLFFALFYILVIFFINIFFFKPNKTTTYIQITIGIILCVFSIGNLLYIREFPYQTEQINGIKLLLLLIIPTELNDVFQYLTGKRWGKHKITPKISPNKTVEGFVGGIILTTLVSNILGIFLLPSAGHIIYTCIGLLISILGFCGDIYISSIKRNAGVKDTGNLIPGHGGLLDRIDSLLFITPLYYWFIYFLYIHN